MINVVIGEKGIGKTKQLIDIANTMATNACGNTVFIGNEKKLMYDLNHNVKLIDINSYNINDVCGLYGFIIGIYANNYDTDNIILDYNFNSDDINSNDFYTFISRLYSFSEKNTVNIWIALPLKKENIPDNINDFIKIS